MRWQWVRECLVIFCLAGILLCSGGCRRNSSSGPKIYDYGFTAELRWENSVDLDLFVADPSGDVWDFYDSIPAIVFAGDNQCGFGDFCDPASCGIYLECNTPELVTVSSVEEGFYTLWVSSWTLSDEDISLHITLPQDRVEIGEAYDVTLACTIPGDTDQAIANIDFPGGGQSIKRISEEQGFVPCTITEQLVRTE